MTEFKVILNKKSATRHLKNPLGCTSYRSDRKFHPSIEKVREMYTAKFTYLDAKGNRVGTGRRSHRTSGTRSVSGSRPGRIPCRHLHDGETIFSHISKFFLRHFMNP